MHGLGRHGARLDGQRRRPFLAGVRPGAGRVGRGDFTFVQISDSHIGFCKEPNKDVTATLQETVAKINALPQRPDFLIHTGDLTHLSKPGEFDTVSEVLKGAKVGKVFYVPGEHDVFGGRGRSTSSASARGPRASGW